MSVDDGNADGPAPDDRLQRIDPALRLDMPELGFQRRKTGEFVFFRSRRRGGWIVPDEKVEALAGLAGKYCHLSQKQSFFSLLALIAWVLTAPWLAPFFAEYLPKPESPDDARALADLSALLYAVILVGAPVVLAIAVIPVYPALRRADQDLRTSLEQLVYDPKAMRPTTIRRSGAPIVYVVLVGVVGLTVVVGGAVELWRLLSIGALIAAFVALCVVLIGSVLLGFCIATARLQSRPLGDWQSPAEWSVDPRLVTEAWCNYKRMPRWRRWLHHAPDSGETARLVFGILRFGLPCLVIGAVFLFTINYLDGRRPSDTDVVGFFERAALQRVVDGQLEAALVRKWIDAPRVAVQGPGSDDVRLTLVEHALETFSRLTGLPWSLVETAEAASLVVVFPYDTSTKPPPAVRTGNVQQRDDGAGHMTGGRLTIIYRSDTAEMLDWGFAFLAGLTGRPDPDEKSVLNGAQRLSALDKLALVLLYDPHLKPGMQRSEAIAQVQEIVANWSAEASVDDLLAGAPPLQPSE